MKNLNEFIKSNSQFLKIADGDTVTMVYKGYSIVPDRFNTGKETVSYLLQYPDTGKGISWNKGSTKVAAQMAKIPVGETISITRFGEGTDTTYRIKIVENQPFSVNEPDESPLP